MKKIFLSLMLLTASLFAELNTEYISQKLMDSKTPIIDIRTAGEWRETGLLADAIPITFFYEDKDPDVPAFLKELNAKVDTTKPFAIICHTGSRTSMLAPFLSEKLHYKVIDLKGGMDYATRGLHLKTYRYMK
ncbi:MAG: rhodanese-like domain-containing protein [Sulfurimonas sp.]